MTTGTDAWQERARRLAAELRTGGALSDPVWQAAFAQTPRHVFVPQLLGDPGEGDRMEEVYRDQALLTQTAAAPDSPETQQLPTSSSSRPAIMAVMLELANITDGQRVLEIGTGTGYNAALLSHRLGAGNVASIDIDSGLVDLARERLAQAGYYPVLAAGDGAQGLAERALYDRILATCALTHIPPAWIGQLADGGRIVAPLAGDVGWLMVLDKTTPGEATGRFDPHPALFMPLRTRADTPLGEGEATAFTDTSMPHYGTTALDPRGVYEASAALKLFCQLHIPGLRHAGGPTSAGDGSLVVHTGSAMAQVAFTPIAPQSWPVIQRGPHRLWDTIEHAVHAWHTLDRPDHTRLGITATHAVDQQYVWLDTPDGPHSWPLRGD